MPFWSGETLEVRLADLIEPFDKNAIDCAAYTLRIGHEIYVSPDREVSEPSRHTKQKLTDGQSFMASLDFSAPQRGSKFRIRRSPSSLSRRDQSSAV